ncbi:MAG: inorganic pyrophosphatase [Nitrospiria bacterium]
MSVSPPFYRWRPHPLHGLEVGPEPPQIVHAYIEMTPFDQVKYEIDKKTGYLRVDRPQRTSSQLPALYGFIPGTYCGDKVKALMEGSSRGDGDPLDICVFSERPVTRSEVILNARVIGGLPMLDDGEADDKIIAVLEGDNIWSGIEGIEAFPEILIERVRHYFMTYKLVPGKENNVSIGPAYGKDHAEVVIRASIEDYEVEYGASKNGGQ